jgi:hypothetical protein
MKYFGIKMCSLSDMKCSVNISNHNALTLDYQNDVLCWEINFIIDIYMRDMGSFDIHSLIIDLVPSFFSWYIIILPALQPIYAWFWFLISDTVSTSLRFSSTVPMYNVSPTIIHLFSDGLAKARGSTLFSLHQSTAADEQPSAQLAVACKRKVILYHVGPVCGSVL